MSPAHHESVWSQPTCSGGLVWSADSLRVTLVPSESRTDEMLLYWFLHFKLFLSRPPSAEGTTSYCLLIYAGDLVLGLETFPSIQTLAFTSFSPKFPYCFWHSWRWLFFCFQAHYIFLSNVLHVKHVYVFAVEALTLHLKWKCQSAAFSTEALTEGTFCSDRLCSISSR